MNHTRKTPLAWKNLTHDWRRLLVAIAGIAFAVLLMFTQVGFQNALFDSQVKLIDDLHGDIFLVSKAKFTLAAEKRFPISRPPPSAVLPRRTRGLPRLLRTDHLGPPKKCNKAWATKDSPYAPWAFALNDPVFNIPTINQQRDKLYPPGTALIDKKSKKKEFKFPRDDDALLAKDRLELASKKLTLVGTFELGTDFAHNGNLVMSAENFAKYFSHRKRFGDPLSIVDIGIVQLQEGADLDETLTLLKKTLTPDVHILTRSQFRAAEIDFWDASTPIGTIFTFGKIIGFIVGMVICYQVIYSDISDHMPEFATLKAMGYPAKYFIRLIVVEALLLAIVGFIPGTLASRLLYGWLGGRTGLLMKMTWDCLLFVLLSTIAMCVTSGLLAVRKLLAADPASLF